MSDEKLRELEHRWRESGTVEDEAAYLRERVRFGDLTQERLELAACLDHPAGRLALDADAPWTFEARSRSGRWQLEAARFGMEPLRRAVLATARHALAIRETHHEDGWENGHDPERMLTLCWRHHRARHLGLLRIEGTAPKFEFVLLDGEVLERSDRGGAFSHENSGFGSVPVSQERVGVADEVERDATLALRSLGLEAREAGAQVQAALASGAGGPWTASELVRAVLRAS